MPNIEIHGCVSEKAAELRRNIFALLGDKPYVKDVVVTIYPTEAVDSEYSPRPFIRLVCSFPQELVYDLLEKLKQLEMDIEYMYLNRFFPKHE